MTDQSNAATSGRLVYRLRDWSEDPASPTTDGGRRLMAQAADEIDRLQDAWSDLESRLLKAHGYLRDEAARIEGKRQGVGLALDYMRGYESGSSDDPTA